MYQYKVEKVLRIIDGDTYELLIDLGFKTYHKITLRLLGIDVYELSTEEGRKAKSWVNWILKRADRIIVETVIKEDSFGRWLGNIGYEYNQNIKSLAVELDKKHYKKPNSKWNL